ncbi:hypothetical protein [Polaromonas sp. YR568]|uniref:hypothetical protein n=1 Tax=Polaromonas sp. YR568 TaxID=1855301 RepID=UPI003137FEF4
MDGTFKTVINKLLIKLLVITVLTNWFILGGYYVKFGEWKWFEFSADQETWAHFGTFYGGLMGPFVGLLAFVGIFITILLQMKQLEIAKQQAEVQEMQRAMASISAQLDQMLSTVPTYYAAKERVRDDVAPLTLFNHIAALGNEYAKTDENREHRRVFEGLNEVMQDIHLSVNAVGLELHSLSWALEKYQEAGGSASMVEFYQLRYGALIGYLEAMGRLDKGSFVRKVFDVEMLRQIMAGKTAPD